jgi:hypothetical protein
MKKYAFHLSLPCIDIKDTKEFYVNLLGASVGRYSDNWIDINLYENQLTFTKVGNFKFDYKNYRFENEILPSFHFGVIVDVDLWGRLYSKLFGMNLEVTAEATFLKNKLGEHLSFFVKDPNGYQIEFKNYKNSDEVFS